MPQPVAQIQIRPYKPGKGPLSGISYDEKSPLNQEKRLTGLCSAVQAQLRPSLTIFAKSSERGFCGLVIRFLLLPSLGCRDRPYCQTTGSLCYFIELSGNINAIVENYKILAGLVQCLSGSQKKPSKP